MKSFRREADRSHKESPKPPKKCSHTSDDDYCASCGEPQGLMRDFINDEMLLDEYPLEIKMKMTPFEIRSAIKRESM